MNSYSYEGCHTAPLYLKSGFSGHDTRFTRSERPAGYTLIITELSLVLLAWLIWVGNAVFA